MFVYGFGEAATRFLSLILLPLFTSYLTPADYGILSILGVVAMVATPVFSLGLGTSIGVCYFEPSADSVARRAGTIWTAFAILLCSSGLLTALATGFAAPISRIAFGTADQATAVALLTISTALTILRTPFMLRLQFEERAKLYAVVAALSSVTTIGSSLLFVVVLHRGVLGMVEGWVVANAVLLVAAGVLVSPGMRLRFEPALAREMIRLGLPLVPAFAALFVLQQANKAMLQAMDGLAAVGIYTIGLNLGMAAGLAVSGFSYAWTPFFLSFADRREEAIALFGRIFTCYAIAFGALGMIFFVTARAVVVVMTRAPFHDAYRVVGFAATGQILVGVFSIFLAGMYFAKEVKYQAVIQTTAALIAVAVNFVAIRWLGVLGAGLGLMLGYLVMAVLQQLWNVRRQYLPVQYDWPRVAQFTVVYAAVAAFSLWPRHFGPALEVALAGTASALIVLMAYAFLTPEERGLLQGFARELPRLRR